MVFLQLHSLCLALAHHEDVPAGEDISVGKTVVGDDLVLAGRNGDLQLIAVPFFIFQIQGLVSAVHKLAHRKVREVCPVLALSLLEDNGAAPLVQDLHRNEAAVLINLCQLVDGVHSGYDAQGAADGHKQDLFGALVSVLYG